MFTRFKKAFPFLAQNNVKLWEWPEDSIYQNGPYCFKTSRAKDVLQWAENHLLRGTFPREDYRELCELIVYYLGGNVSITYVFILINA